ncbi:DUF5691 domain-containing protein [Streptomyces sp. WMMC500]|uniref:DUF5691 domain-containing protein n=1 Tax=Streptomyces sp. WMMC500 TaxID=3015154 RepID=UPI00248AC889|nr:DUF5691 domain-containing protein [Streptomyces sp. WMMC500]WBB63649.1 DUF5691 domain-containing protein [Streptomyces sp. WMMC500]
MTVEVRGFAADAAGGWGDLVAAAVVGAGRRGVDEGALLDAAAAATVRRRAGIVPGPARRLPEPAGHDPRPRLPAAARRRLAALLADRSGTGGGSRRGPAPDLAELIPEWLRQAVECGYQAPPELLPALLDAARARIDLRPHALALAGPRGLWLAERAPQWAPLLRDGAAGPALPDPRDADAVRALWEEGPRTGGPGTGQVRGALFAEVRRADPAGAVELLVSTWSAEKAEDRLAFVELLRTGLSLADEPFLEDALADRSRGVRAAAAELLAGLPGSALAGRMAARVRSLVVLDRSEEPPVIAVEAPYECDAAMQRDGVVATPPAGMGERSWWFGQLVAAAPLALWQAVFDGRTPEEIVALPVADGWRSDLLAAWSRAAARQHDSAWARALLGAAPASSPNEPPAFTAGPAGPSSAPGSGEHIPGRDPARLLTALPEGERAAWVAEFISAHGLSEAFRLLGACAVPWPEELGRAVVDALEIARDGGSYPWSFSGVMGLAERCLDPSYAVRLEPLAAMHEEAEESSPGAAGYWSEAFQRLVATLRIRAAMRDELTTPAALRP